MTHSTQLRSRGAASWPFTLAGLGLVALAAGAGLAPTVASAPASGEPASAALEPAAVSLRVPADHSPAGLGCWVTGDMIWAPEGGGDGNPAAAAQAVCGGR